MTYYIGIDAGGTSTSLSLIDYSEPDTYVTLKNISLPSIHLLHVPETTAQTILKEAMDEMSPLLPEKETIAGVSIGMAGYGNDRNMRKKIESFFKNTIETDYKIFNDAEVALEGALNGQDGILLISGTGSICLSKRDNTIFRTGGWGYMIGDEGSGYWLGKKLLQLYSMQVDGRRPKTQLYHLMKKRCGLENDYDIITFVSDQLNNNRTEIAKLGTLFLDLNEINDPEVDYVIDEMSTELACLINVHLVEDSPIKHLSYMGGVISKNEILRQAVEEKLIKSIKFQPPEYGPEIGAVMKMVRIDRD